MPWGWVAAATIGSALLGSESASDAADTQAQAAREATAGNTAATDASIAEQRRQFDISTGILQDARAEDSRNFERSYGDYQRSYNDARGDYAQARADVQPYRDAGVSALGRLRTMLDSGAPSFRPFTLADFWSDPVTKASYQSGLDLGEKAINNMAGARGGKNSGATLKALNRFGTDYTGGQAAGSQARFVGEQERERGIWGDQFSRTATVAGMGAGPSPSSTIVGGPGSGNATAAAGAQANLGTGFAGNVGQLMTGNANANANLLTGAANARGAAAISGANAISGGVNNLANWWSGQQNLDKILAAQGARGGMTNTAPWFGGGF